MSPDHPRSTWWVAALAGCLVASLVLGATAARHRGGRNGSSGAAASPAAAPQVMQVAPVAHVLALAPTAPQPDPRWAARVADASGIPLPAVRAYGRAELWLAREQPRCHLGWNTLAGVGWVESQHGTLGGRLLDDSGHSTSAVRGPALDGSADVAAIPGRSGWAHAQGPMQFLAVTWNRWSTDGDADGVADVDDLDDAALAAGRYLCADAHDLATAAGWNAAVLSYNHSVDYLLSVHRAAVGYAVR